MAPPTSWHWSYVRQPTFDPVRNDFIGVRETNKQTYRTYCKACLQIDIDKVVTEENLLVQTGVLPQSAKRSPAQIELQLFQGADSGAPKRWTKARVDQINIHLSKCNNIDPAIKALALETTVTSAQRKVEMASANAGVSIPPSSSFGPPSSDIGASSQFQPPNRNPSQFQPTNPITTWASSLSMVENPHRIATPPGSLIGTMSGTSLDHLESISHHAPSFDPGEETESAKRRRLGSQANRGSRSASHSQGALPAGRAPSRPPSQWSSDKNAEFLQDLLTVIAACDLSFNLVENPTFRYFIQKYVPSAKLPSRNTLSGSVLTNHMISLRNQACIECQDEMATVSCDGWTGRNSQHLVAFMITTQGGKVLPVCVNNTTTERKTANLLLEQMKEVLEILKRDWRVKVIAFTSDASGESRRACTDLLRLMPNLVVLDCYAHQINLVVGDLYKKTGPCYRTGEDCVKNGERPKSVIRPCETRWTSYLLAYQRLMELRESISVIIINDQRKAREEDRMIIQGNAQAKAKATLVVEKLKSPAFWESVSRLVTYLKPLAIATNITQAAFCRLDDVLVTFGVLTTTFGCMVNSIDADAWTTVLQSLEKRWGATDQLPFIIAAILNPFIGLTPFQRSTEHSEHAHFFSTASINAALRSLYFRFFNIHADSVKIYKNYQDYLERKGEYQLMKTQIPAIAADARAMKQSPDPRRLYLDLLTYSPSADYAYYMWNAPPLTHLAIHLFSICPNSASCERLFSSYGQILTDKRTSLLPRRMCDLAEMKIHIRRELTDSQERQKLADKAKCHFEHQQAIVDSLRSTAEGSTRSTVLPSTGHSFQTGSLRPIRGRPLPGGPGTGEPMDVDSDGEEDGGETESANHEYRRTFETLTEHTLEDANPTPFVTPSLFPDRDIRFDFTPIPLKHLFDFGSDFWVNYVNTTANKQLNEERDIFEYCDEISSASDQPNSSGNGDGYSFEQDGITASTLFA